MAESIGTEKVSIEAIAAKLYEELTAKDINTTKNFTKQIARLYPQIIGDLLVENKDVEIQGIGTLKLKRKAAYTGRNPRTGEAVSVAESVLLNFTPASGIKKRLNEK